MQIKWKSKLLQEQVCSLESALLDSWEKSTHTYWLLQNKQQKNLHAQASKFATLAQLNIMASYDLPKALQEARIATKALSNLTDTSEHKLLLLTHCLDLANAEAAWLTKSLAESQKQVHQLQTKLMHSVKSLSKASVKGSVLKKPQTYYLCKNGAYTPAAWCIARILFNRDAHRLWLERLLIVLFVQLVCQSKVESVVGLFNVQFLKERLQLIFS